MRILFGGGRLTALVILLLMASSPVLAQSPPVKVKFKAAAPTAAAVAAAKRADAVVALGLAQKPIPCVVVVPKSPTATAQVSLPRDYSPFSKPVVIGAIEAKQSKVALAILGRAVRAATQSITSDDHSTGTIEAVFPLNSDGYQDHVLVWLTRDLWDSGSYPVFLIAARYVQAFGSAQPERVLLPSEGSTAAVAALQQALRDTETP